MTSETVEHFAVLEGVPTSVRHARHEVTRLLRDVGLADHLDTAVLLVSELVTNAVLHAGGDITLRVTADPGGVRIEVHDRSPAHPTPRSLEGDDSTGRGVGMVEALATAWGITEAPGGKTVWFEVGRPAPAPATGDRPARPTTAAVVLEEAPTELAITAIRVVEASVRELVLLNLTAEQAVAAPGLDLGPILGELTDAAHSGTPRVDIAVEAPVDAAPAAWATLSLFKEADARAAAGELLSSPALPEVAACAVWLLSQIGWQLEGGAPAPWRLPADSTPATVDVQLDPTEADRLRSLAGAVVAADDAHRIVFVSDDAAELLGWDPRELVGRRLTAIIPPALREAHLAGFGRYHVSGEARILGRRIEVPALRGDGKEVPVTLTVIASAREQHAGGMFIAWFEPRPG